MEVHPGCTWKPNILHREGGGQVDPPLSAPLRAQAVARRRGRWYTAPVKELPDDLGSDDVRGALARGWGLDANALSYVPLGFGSYHWAAEAGSRRLFLTADDLDAKPWLGADRPSVADGLRSALATAAALREERTLAFVLAPLRTLSGEVLHRIDARYTLSVFPFVEGRSGAFGDRADAERRRQRLRLVADLHLAQSPSQTPRRSLAVPQRDMLEGALASLDRPWSSGP